MSVSALEELRSAVDTADDGTIFDTFRTFENAVASEIYEERKSCMVATTVRYLSHPDSEAFSDGTAYIHSLVSLEAKREQLSQSVFEYLTTDASRKAVGEAISRTIERYEALEKRTQALDSAAESVEVPAILAFDTIEDITVPIEEHSTVDVPLSNVGSKPTVDVDLEVSGPPETTIDPPVIESLDSGESAAVRIHTIPERTGYRTVTARASSDTLGDATTFELQALNRATFILRIERAVRSMTALVDEGTRRRRGDHSVRHQLERIERRLKDTRDAENRNEPHQSIDRRLKTAKNQLTRIRSRLQNESGLDLDRLTVSELNHGITDVIEEIEVLVDGA
jgi:hypothetical protein